MHLYVHQKFLIDFFEIFWIYENVLFCFFFSRKILKFLFFMIFGKFSCDTNRSFGKSLQMGKIKAPMFISLWKKKCFWSNLLGRVFTWRNMKKPHCFRFENWVGKKNVLFNWSALNAFKVVRWYDGNMWNNAEQLNKKRISSVQFDFCHTISCIRREFQRKTFPHTNLFIWQMYVWIFMEN